MALKTVAELLKVGVGGPGWLIDGLLLDGVSLLSAPPKAGKNHLILDATRALTSGDGEYLGRSVTCGEHHVSMMCLDPGGIVESTSRFKALGGNAHQLSLDDDPTPLAPGNTNGLVSYIKDLTQRGTTLFVLDNLLGAMPPAYSINDDTGYRFVTRPLDAIAAEGIAVLLIHHTGKSVRGPMGHTGIWGWARHGLEMSVVKGGDRRLSFAGNYVTTKTRALNLRMDDKGGGVRFSLTGAGGTSAVQSEGTAPGACRHDREPHRLTEAEAIAKMVAAMSDVGTNLSEIGRRLKDSPPTGFRVRKSPVAYANFIRRGVLDVFLTLDEAAGRYLLTERDAVAA